MLRRTLRLLSRYCTLHRPRYGRRTPAGPGHRLLSSPGSLCWASFSYNAATGQSKAERCSGCRGDLVGTSLGLAPPPFTLDAPPWSHSSRVGLTLQTDGTSSYSPAEVVSFSSPEFMRREAQHDKADSSDGSADTLQGRKPVLISLPVLLL